MAGALWAIHEGLRSVPARVLSQRQDLCSTAPEVQGNLRVEDVGEWSNARQIDVAVVRSPLGIAETGSVLLSEEELLVNTIGFFAHDIIV